MIEEYALVKLKKEIPGYDIPLGSRGTVVMVHHADPPGYEVEFVDSSGETLCDSKTGCFVFTLDENFVELVK